MDIRRGEERVDAGTRRGFDCRGTNADVVFGCSSKPTDNGPGIVKLGGDGGDRSALTGGCRGKSGLDDVDPEESESASDSDFFVDGHRAARSLLAITEGCVENAHAIGRGRERGGRTGSIGF